MSGWSNISKIPELQRRMLWTLLILAAYRLGAHIPLPGVNAEALKNLLGSGAGGGVFGMIDVFTGGGFLRMSVFALGIMPYITASIILELMTVVFPYLDRLKKEGEVGRKKITQYTRYLSIALSAIQSIAIAFMLERMVSGGQASASIVNHPGMAFRLMTIVTLTAGTALIMWLGEQITERGIGNGMSLIIFAGIVVRIPQSIIQLFGQISTGEQNPIALFFVAVVMVAVIGGIVFVERSQRKIAVQYPSRTVGRKVYKGVKTHLPLKVNPAGVIPPIFASSLLMFPSTFLGYLNSENSPWLTWLQSALNGQSWQYNTLYGALIIFFTFFYTAVQFNPIDVADNLKKHGGYVPGVRPGQNTSDYIDRILTRITVGGALYLVAVCVLPSIFTGLANVPFYYGGTSLLIVVGVAMDTAAQMEAHLIARHYDGFLGAKGPRMKGRRQR